MKQEPLLDENSLTIFQDFAIRNKDEIIHKKIENLLDTLRNSGQPEIDDKLKQELMKEFKNEYNQHIVCDILFKSII